MGISRGLSLVLVGGVLATACGSTPAAQPSPSSEPRPATTTDSSDAYEPSEHAEFELELAGLEELTPELALESLGRAVGPVDGLTDQPADADAGPLALHLALDRLALVADDLEPGQRDAVKDLVEGIMATAVARRRLPAGSDAFEDAPDVRALGPGPQPATASAQRLAAEEGDEQEARMRAVLEPAIIEARDSLRTQTGFTEDRDIDLTIVTSERLDDGSIGASIGRDTWLGVRAFDCEIVFGRFPDGKPANMIRALVHHEVFHCFQRLMAPTTDAIRDRPLWVSEGTAAWVGEEAGGGTSISRNWWHVYLASPGYRPSDAAPYAAIGYVSHAFHAGADPWTTLRRVFRSPAQGGDDDYYDLLTEDVPAAFLNSYGPSRMRDVTWRDRWTTDGPGILPGQLSVLDMLLADDGVLPWGGSRLLARSAPTPGDLLVARGEAAGAMRFSPDAGPETEVAGSFEHAWCHPTECSCPDGSAPPGFEPTATPEGGESLVIGVAGPPGGGSISVETVSLDDLCGECPEAAGPPGEVAVTTVSTRTPALAAAADCTEDAGPPSDGCIEGRWLVAPQALAGQIEGLLAIEGVDDNPTVDPAGGSVTATYEDGTVEVVYDSFRLLMIQQDTGLPMTLTFDGSGVGTYRLVDGQLVTDPGPSSITVSVTIGDTVIPGGIGFDGDDFDGVIGTGDLECSVDLMTITVDVPGGDQIIYVLTPT